MGFFFLVITEKIPLCNKNRPTTKMGVALAFDQTLPEGFPMANNVPCQMESP